MVTNDKKEAAKSLIDSGHIKNLKDVFKFIPPTPIANEMRMNYSRMKALRTDPSKWVLKDLKRLADILDVDFKVVVELVVNQITMPEVSVNKKAKK